MEHKPFIQESFQPCKEEREEPCVGQRHPEEAAWSPGTRHLSDSPVPPAAPSTRSREGPGLTTATSKPTDPPSTRTRQMLHSPQPQLADICPILLAVFSLIALVFLTPCEEPLPKQTWGWGKEASRSSGAPQQLDGSCPGSQLPSTPLWFLREAVQQCLLYPRHSTPPPSPNIPLCLPQPRLPLQSRSRDTDTHGVPWDCRTRGRGGDRQTDWQH